MFPAIETWGSLPLPGLDVRSPKRERCRCGFDVALRKQRGPMDGVFKSLVPGPVQRVGVLIPSLVGQSGGWSG